MTTRVAVAVRSCWQRHPGEAPATFRVVDRSVRASRGRMSTRRSARCPAPKIDPLRSAMTLPPPTLHLGARHPGLGLIPAPRHRGRRMRARAIRHAAPSRRHGELPPCRRQGEAVGTGASHAARLAASELDRWVGKILGWRDAWWRHTIRCLHGSSAADGTPNRLGRGHRQLGRRHWDDPIQRTTEPEFEGAWQSVAQDRNRWREIETTFIARVTRAAKQHVGRLPHGRHMMDEDWM